MSTKPKFVLKSVDPRIDLKSRLVHFEPKEMPGTNPWILMEAKYVDDTKTPKELHIITPKQAIWGIKTKYVDKVTRTQIKDYYLQLPLTSTDTVANPTPEEANFISYMETCADAAWENLVALHAKGKSYMKEIGIPLSVYTTLGEVISGEEERGYALKSWSLPGSSIDPATADLPPGQQKFIEDPTKPRKALYNLAKSTKKGFKNLCEFFPPLKSDDPPLKPGQKPRTLPLADVLENRDMPRHAMIKARISYDGVYLGSHGKDQSWCASMRFRVHEMNWSPIPKSMAEHVLEPNTDAYEMDEDEMQYQSQPAPYVGMPLQKVEASNADYDEDSQDEPIVGGSGFKPVLKSLPVAAAPAPKSQPIAPPTEATDVVRHKKRKSKHRTREVEPDDSE